MIKKFFIILFLIISIVLILLYFLAYDKSTNLYVPFDIRLSKDGSKLNFVVSTDYSEVIPMFKKIKTKYIDNKILVTFYFNKIYPNVFNIENDFTINLDSSYNEIYFYSGSPNEEYYLAIKKNEVSNNWERVKWSEWPKRCCFL